MSLRAPSVGNLWNVSKYGWLGVGAYLRDYNIQRCIDSVAWSPSSPSLGLAKNEQSTLNGGLSLKNVMIFKPDA